MRDQSELDVYGMILKAWSAQVHSYWQLNSYFAAFETAALGGTWFIFSREGGGEHFIGWWFWFLGIVLTGLWVHNNLKNHAYLM